ncbi:Crp/Fnr family transcriptional regulator [Hyphomicrobium denitrificans 1NES1]|uniref:Crp/Fnr family transcriptional regulator n=1 Tax=Hyphomicrobium denitrificans 1NES1 TaxID=670307 RepID=N0BBK6_9HYPH|nr:cyclic nucleotide-binding domain-containing protein [Hyphomicrobium denitrificans]AGK59642.1 Crp/Fnr family transcriptional regulator [Hyphomicrobium denitrificans 1NES1]
MAIDALVRPFLSLPLFRDLKPLQISEIARHAERIVYRNGDVIAAEGQSADAAILIVSGTCVRRAVDRKKTRDEFLPEGSLVAELAMLIEVIHPTTIVARDQVKALKIARERMHELMQQDVDMAAHFSSLILKRLHTLADDLLAVDSLLSGSVTATKALNSRLAFKQSGGARAVP